MFVPTWKVELKKYLKKKKHESFKWKTVHPREIQTRREILITYNSGKESLLEV